MATPRLSTGKKILFSGIVLISFLLVAEGLVRGWVYYLREDYTRYDHLTGMPRLVPGEHGRGAHPIVINSDGFVGDELSPDAPDLFRIVALGDSNTFGGGTRDLSYPGVLQRLLRERSSDARRYEVVNAGIEGLDSAQVLRRLREDVEPLDPEIVIVYVGWNDLMKYDPLGQSGGGAAAAASRFVDRLWLVKGVRKLIFYYVRPRLDPPATGPESLTNRFEDFSPDTYIQNLSTVIDEIRQMDAAPVLMTMTTVVRPDFTPEDIVRQSVYMPYYPSGYAVRDFLVLVDAYNDAIRRIAASKDVPIVDLEAFFLARPDYLDLFYDTMHPTNEGYALVAEEVLEVLDGQQILAGSPTAQSGFGP